jgi:hypothetical protein
MANIDLEKDRAENKKKQQEFERKELIKDLSIYSHSLHLDPVPDPAHSADGVFSFIDEKSLTRCDRDKNKELAVNSWVVLKIVQSIKGIVTEDTKAAKRIRGVLTSGWGIKIVYQNNERELRRKFWFEITGKILQLPIKL